MVSLKPSTRLAAPLAVVAFVALAPSPAAAAVPVTLAVQGQLSTVGGGAAVDGYYKLTFSLYDKESAAQASWTERATLKVVGGRFSHVLGSVTPLSAKVVGSDAARWLGVRMGDDVELSRQPLHSVATAVRAAIAEDVACTGCIKASAAGFTYAGAMTKGGPAVDLACTGCVSIDEMKFDGDIDLGAHSLHAKDIKLSGGLVATTVAANKLAGDGSALTGVRVVGGFCKRSRVVIGVKTDGSVACGEGGGSTNKTLGGMLSTVFTEKAAVVGLPVAIPDNTGAPGVVQATFGPVGKAMTIAVKIALKNTDLSTVRIVLLPPDDKKEGLTVCDPCGAKDAKGYSATLTETSKLAKGSLSTLLGKDLKGDWTLQVLDSSYCLGQVPANQGICDVKAKTDGVISKFAVSGTVTSSQSVRAAGTLQFVLLAAAPFACTPSRAGHAYFDTALAKLRYCDGAHWRALSDSCGNGILEAGEECDDGNNAGDDGCSATCIASTGFSAGKPGLSCLDIYAKSKANGVQLTNGVRWIDPNGGKADDAFRARCDMTTDGGGWTLVMKTGNGTGHSWSSAAQGAANLLSTALPSTNVHYKLSDAQMNAIKAAVSKPGDAIAIRMHESQTYNVKKFGKASCTLCTSYADACDKDCVWGTGAWSITPSWSNLSNGDNWKFYLGAANTGASHGWQRMSIYGRGHYGFHYGWIGDSFGGTLWVR